MSMHIQQRLRQRGVKEDDLALVCDVGETFSDGYMMTKRAVSEEISRLKAEIQRLEKLKGVMVIEQRNTLVTVYRPNHTKCRLVLEHGKSISRKHKECSYAP
ncbi:hypothetical protein [Sedimenticola hydrogenitrophicus]|uniref:hypothetical protein n=1 Tax=Sedimenticola hydrogenitrophicus TaxID=2967975 RepID=UPI0023B02CA2|nr:hypothetical protein [Sedimenticola hydrogenitrophicus]